MCLCICLGGIQISKCGCGALNILYSFTDGFGYQKEIESACIFVYCKNAVLVMNAYGSMLPAALDVVNPCNISLAYRYSLGLNLSSNSNIYCSVHTTFC